MPQVPCVCLMCGCTFTVPQNVIQLGKGKYCSVTCYRQHERLERERLAVSHVCLECHTTYTLLPSELRQRRGKYCSAKCYRKVSRLITRVCLECQCTFTVYGDSKYCSQQCYHQARTTPLAERFWSYVLKTEDCWLWQGGTYTTGYGRIVIDNKQYRAHRIAYELYYGRILPGLFCCHHCDQPLCVRPSHLFLGTGRDNLQDMSRKGRSGAHVHPETLARGERSGAYTHPEKVRRGEQCYQAKLTDEQVRQIRHLRATEQWTHRRIAAFFGVSRPVIGKILNGKNWRHVL